MTQLSVFPLGLSPTEVASLEAFCRLASRRTSTWNVASTIDSAVGVLALAGSSDKLAACQHYQSVGGCILVLDTGLSQGMQSVKSPLQLSGAFFVFDFFQRNGAANAALAAHLATQDLLQAFSIQATPAQTVRPVTVTQAEQPLPTVTQPAAAVQPKSDVRKLPIVPVNQKPGLLIVDDSQVAQKYMEKCLQSLGFASDLASSGDEALVMLSRHPYQYVFLDVNMAGLDGYQTCRAIKSFKGHASAPPNVFMTTSRVGAIDKIRGTLAGCDAYLTKPINGEHLSALLSRLELVATLRKPEMRVASLRNVGNGANEP